MGQSWGYLGAIWRPGCLKRPLYHDTALLGLSWGHLEAILGTSWSYPGAILGLSWAHLEPSWGNPGGIWVPSGGQDAQKDRCIMIQPSWGYLGAILRLSWERLGAILGPSWGYLSCGSQLFSFLRDKEHLSPFLNRLRQRTFSFLLKRFHSHFLKAKSPKSHRTFPALIRDSHGSGKKCMECLVHPAVLITGTRLFLSEKKTLNCSLKKNLALLCAPSFKNNPKLANPKKNGCAE